MVIYTEGTRRNPFNKKSIEYSDKCWKTNGIFYNSSGNFEPTKWVMFPKSGGFEVQINPTDNKKRMRKGT